MKCRTANIYFCCNYFINISFPFQGRGIVYLSHVPFGFFEKEMYKFFSQVIIYSENQSSKQELFNLYLIDLREKYYDGKKVLYDL